MGTARSWRETTRMAPLQVNPTTKRHARTLVQAFGAHTDSIIVEKEPLGHRVCTRVCVAGVVASLLVIAVGVMS